MLTWVLRRILAVVPVLFGVTLAVFSMLFLVPGDPVKMMLAEFVTTPDQIAQMRAQLHLDEYDRHVGAQPMPLSDGLLFGDQTVTAGTVRDQDGKFQVDQALPKEPRTFVSELKALEAKLGAAQDARNGR